MEYVLWVICDKFNCIFCCIVCIHKSLKNKIKIFQKKVFGYARSSVNITNKPQHNETANKTENLARQLKSE